MAPRKMTAAQITNLMEGPAAEPEAEVKPLRSVVDIDALIREDLEAAAENVVEKGPVIVMGREWMIVEPQNSLHSFRMGDLANDPMAIIDAMKDCVTPDQRADFIQALKTAAILPTDVLMKIVNAILEVAFARPTSPSKPSSRRSPARRK